MKHWSEFTTEDFEITTWEDKKTKENKEYDKESDNILTLDIEVSSGWLKNNKVIPYHAGETEQYWNEKIPVSLCYIWMFSFDGTVYYGRDFREFPELLRKLPKRTHFIIYVHNLGYEFSFMQNILTFTNVFARDAYKIMKCSAAEFPSIEFRCSLFLTRLSLASWGKKIGLPKMVGDLDYIKLRTPLTKLTNTELGYCSRDCEVVDAGIKQYRERYKHIREIPLTQTGEVRKVLKRKVQKDRKTYNLLMRLLPQNAKMYNIMVDCFSGGYTHANFAKAGVVFSKEEDNLPKGYGTAFDFTSSYPTVMVCEKFPVTRFAEDKFELSKINEKAYMLKVRFESIESKTQNHYISFSKCFDIEDGRKMEIDNGRVYKGENFSMWMTEIDLSVIMKTYKGSFRIEECYSSRKGYLPKPIVEAVLEFYSKKTAYKDLEGYEDIYAQMKQFLNSIFGCCVQKIVPDEISYNYKDYKWYKQTANDSMINEELDKLKTKNKGKTYTAYQWGVWITAYGRLNLWNCMQHEYPDGRKVDQHTIYCDTDSLKLDDDFDFSWYNEIVTEKLRKACEYHGLDFELTQPKDKDGVKHPLGVFDRESNWSEFITWGAKRYCYRSCKDGKLHLTISGINKDAVAVLNDDIYNFTGSTVFDKDSYFYVDGECYTALDESGNPAVHKKLIIHTNEQPRVIWNEGAYDEWESNDLCGIAMRNTSYSMSIEDTYRALLTNIV